MSLLSSPIAAAVFIVISAFFNASFCSGDDGFFPNCDRTFTCGSLHNITYPFTGGNRPEYCGPPEFRLTCRNNTYAELTSKSVTYHVLEINQTQKSLVLTRPDFSNNTCVTNFVNSSLDTAIFTYHRVGNEDINLFYGCTHVNINYIPSNRFSCTLKGVNETDSYFLVGPVPDSLAVQNLTKCQVGVVTLVNSNAAERLINNQTTLRETLKEGFNVNYNDTYSDRCSSCTSFGGRCGFRSNISEFICICPDNRPCSVPSTVGRKDTKEDTDKVEPDVVRFTGGAMLAGIVIGWCFFSFMLWRKHRASQSAEGKEMATLPSINKGLTSPPSITLSRSMRSYRSAKSEFGKESTYFGVQIFSYAELEEITDNFNPSIELGDGGFGTVYYGELQDGRAVAVKRLYENNFKGVEQFMNEVGILTGLSHDNLVKLYGCTSKQSRELLLVYEYIPNGTVAEHLHGKRKNSGFLSWEVRLNIAIETADALSYLHASDIIHRDVKTNNILLNDDFHVKVADFGLSRAFPNDASHISTAPQGTPGYVDPEYYQCYQLTDKSDVYSFGVVLMELISSKEAVDTKRDRADIILANMAVNKIQNRRLDEMVDPHIGFETNSCVKRSTTQVAELAFRCLQTERELRPSMKEALEALRGIKNEHYPETQKTEVVDTITEAGDGILKRLLSFSIPPLASKWR